MSYDCQKSWEGEVDKAGYIHVAWRADSLGVALCRANGYLNFGRFHSEYHPIMDRQLFRYFLVLMGRSMASVEKYNGGRRQGPSPRE